jgi:predicted membrane protein
LIHPAVKEYFYHWELILVAVGLIGLFSHERKGKGLFFLLVGGALYLRHYIDISFNFWQLFWPALLMLAGSLIIFRRKLECPHNNKEIIVDENVLDELAVFGGSDRTINAQQFKGGKITTIFGGVNLNLKKAKMAPGNNFIDLFAIFGGMKLIVPDEWNIKISVVSIFGGLSDKHRIQTVDTDESNKSQLIIKGFVLFGGGEIRSY